MITEISFLPFSAGYRMTEDTRIEDEDDSITRKSTIIRYEKK